MAGAIERASQPLQTPTNEELLESPKFMTHLSNMYVCAPRTKLKLLGCRARKLVMPLLSLHRPAKCCSTAYAAAFKLALPILSRTLPNVAPHATHKGTPAPR